MPARKKFRITKTTKNKDLPATVGLVLEVRDELKADNRAHDALFDKMEARIEERFQELISRYHRMEMLFEEQRSENRIVLDAYKSIMEEHRKHGERLKQG